MREACAWVCERARDVRPGPLDRLLEALAGREVPEWDGRHHFRGTRERIRRYVLVLDSLNFSFWGGAAGGYWQLAERLRDVFEAGGELEDPSRLAGIGAARLRELIGELPMLEERAEALRQLGRHGFEGLVLETAVATAAGLAARLPSFADVAGYGGRGVPFLKRAQIAAADLAGAGAATFPDLADLTCFADYKLPQVLRHLGALAYSEPLARRVDGRRPLEPGEPAEVEIRAATVFQVERLREALAAGGRPLRSVDVDWMLWDFGQELGGEPGRGGDEYAGRVRPHHRVRTIFY